MLTKLTRFAISIPGAVPFMLRVRHATLGYFRLGVMCVVACGCDLLMIRHTYGDRKWTFPGGLAKRYESPEGAARREVREETDVVLGDVESLDTVNMRRPHRRRPARILFAQVSQKGGRADGVEIAELRWFSATEVPMADMKSEAIRAYRRFVALKGKQCGVSAALPPENQNEE